MHDELPKTESEIDAFLAAFEDGSLPKEQWTHAAHIFTGACYVREYGEAAAIDRMRERVSAFNLAVGGQNTATSGYHETVTVFWIKRLAGFCSGHSDLGRSELALRAVSEFVGQREIYVEFYDFDILKSEEARRVWIEPNGKKHLRKPKTHFASSRGDNKD
jgi:hypothetical protein